MFSISTKGDYGLLLLVSLAQKAAKGQTYVSLREVAGEKGISEKYLSQIMGTLKKAHLVESKEGRDGGYCLAKEPQAITLMEVLEVLEGPVAPVKCCSRARMCAQVENCSVKSTWRQATTMLTDFLQKTTIADTMRSPLISQ